MFRTIRLLKNVGREEAVNAPYVSSFLTSDRGDRRQDRPVMRLQPS